jgi:hypothetical protein
MQLSTADNTLTIGTHGRGVWQIAITSTGSIAGRGWLMASWSPGSSASPVASGSGGAGAPAPIGGPLRPSLAPLAARPIVHRPIRLSSSSQVVGPVATSAGTTATAAPRLSLADPGSARGGTIVPGAGLAPWVTTSQAAAPAGALGVLPILPDALAALDAILDNRHGHRRTSPAPAV